MKLLTQHPQAADLTLTGSNSKQSQARLSCRN